MMLAKLRAACGGSEPSGGHDYADEMIGLLRVARSQRDDAERSLTTSRAECARLAGALREWVAAHDGEVAAAKHAARVRVTEHRKWPDPPKRMPRNAKFIHDLPPEEQRRISEQCAKEMAPIKEAEGLHKAARERLEKALAAARAALPPSEPTT